MRIKQSIVSAKLINKCRNTKKTLMELLLMCLNLDWSNVERGHQAQRVWHPRYSANQRP